MIEHVVDFVVVVCSIVRVFCFGGWFYFIIDNIGFFDFVLFKGCYWGGYYFLWYWNLFD